MECLKFKSVSKGSLVGYADLWIEKWGIEIHGCTLHQKDGKRWVNFPSREFKDQEGNTKYASIVRMRNKAFYDEFTRQAKEAIERRCMEESKKQEHVQYEMPLNEECPF